MEVYPEKLDGTHYIMHYAHDAVYHPFLSGYTSIHQKLITVVLLRILSKHLQVLEEKSFRYIGKYVLADNKYS